jgi:arginase
MTLLRSTLEQLNNQDIAMIGFPWDLHASYLPGSAAAPEQIIAAIESPSANYFTERLTDLDEQSSLKWLGSHELSDFFDIEKCIHKILTQGAIPFGLGGDHSIIFPIMKAIHAQHGPVNIIQFDAHNDLYDDFEGNPLSHASPFARIMENNLAHRLIQVGIRTTTQHQREQADRFGVEVFDMDTLDQLDLSEVTGPVYITFDMDVLDPAFAPGVSHHEPGGMSTREALTILKTIHAPIVGMDLVELNPDRDIQGVTAMVAAKIVKEMIDLVLRQWGY